MLHVVNGKLLVYVSSFQFPRKRIESVRIAVERIARVLNLNVEVVTLMEKSNPIYVYYKNHNDEPIPIYCDRDGKSSMQEICTAIRNMMFVLSFHPKHGTLKRLRKEIMRFS